MDEQRPLMIHFLAGLAYRTQKALGGAPDDFGTFQAGHDTRSPAAIVCHMTSVLGYARTHFIGGTYRPEPLPSLSEEVQRFHAMIDDLAAHLRNHTPLTGITLERLLQGPFSDAMTHAGQLAMLRRLAGHPIPPENFILADIHPDRLGIDQPAPVSPDLEWPEAPVGWVSPSSKR